MAKFICRLGTPAGDIITRTIDAVGMNDARLQLEGEGFRVFSVNQPNRAGGLRLSGSGAATTAAARGRIKPNDFLLFNQQLSALLRAGIPILQTVTMLRKRATVSRLRSVLDDVEEQIRGGASLSSAFVAQNIFPRLYTASILAGERSGALDDVLARYVAYTKRSAEIRRKIRGALAYPLLLLGASLAMVTFLTLFVVPRMSLLFAGFGAELPLVTVVVVGISTTVAGNIFWLAPLLIAAVVGFVFWSRTPNGRQRIDATLLRLPIAGELLRQLAVAQVTRSLSTLLAGGIPLVESWEIASESLTNHELRRRSSSILPMVREGRSFTESLEKADWMPALAIDMVGVGERSGSLRDMLEEVAIFYDAEAEVRLEQLTTVLEPAILLFMGGIVVTILLAIYLPIIQSISNASTSR